MSDKESSITDLVERVYGFLEARLKLLKIYAVEKTAALVSNLIAAFILIAFFGIAWYFISISLAFLISQWLNSYALGFGIMALFYIILAWLVIRYKRKLLYKPLVNKFIAILYPDNQKD